MNLRPPGYEPGELPDCSTPHRRPCVGKRTGLKKQYPTTHQCSRGNQPPGYDTWRPLSVGRIGSGFYTTPSLHYNTSKTDIADKADKLYFSSKKRSNSFLTLSAVAFLPNLIATSPQDNFWNMAYRIIRCILCGIVFIQDSTCSLIPSAFALRSSRTRS